MFRIPLYQTANNTVSLNTCSKLLVLVIVMICSISCILLYSAANGNFHHWAIKQLYTCIIFIPLMLIISTINTKIIYSLSYYIYFAAIFLLILVELLGYNAMGAQRWLRYGIINVQPSEFMKIAIIIALARYFHKIRYSETQKLHSLIIPIILTAVPIALIIKQPNLGTAIIMLIISCAIFFAVGVRLLVFIVPTLAILISLPIIWHSMHEYQKVRVLSFINPENDILGAGYNIMQSKIAIGSGGLTGKGILNGSQSQLSFLPEKHTDFIFTLLAEEHGLIGCTFVILLYAIVIILCYNAAINNYNQFSRLVATGIATFLFAHVFVNIAMISGLLPAVGIPIALLSFGGSNLSALLLGIGLVLNTQVYSKTVIPRC